MARIHTLMLVTLIVVINSIVVLSETQNSDLKLDQELDPISQVRIRSLSLSLPFPFLPSPPASRHPPGGKF